MMRGFDTFWSCFGILLFVISCLLPFVLFSGEPDLVDAFVKAISCQNGC